MNRKKTFHFFNELSQFYFWFILEKNLMECHNYLIFLYDMSIFAHIKCQYYLTDLGAYGFSKFSAKDSPAQREG